MYNCTFLRMNDHCPLVARTLCMCVEQRTPQNSSAHGVFGQPPQDSQAGGGSAGLVGRMLHDSAAYAQEDPARYASGAWPDRAASTGAARKQGSRHVRRPSDGVPRAPSRNAARASVPQSPAAPPRPASAAPALQLSARPPDPVASAPSFADGLPLARSSGSAVAQGGSSVVYRPPAPWGAADAGGDAQGGSHPQSADVTTASFVTAAENSVTLPTPSVAAAAGADGPATARNDGSGGSGVQPLDLRAGGAHGEASLTGEVPPLRSEADASSRCGSRQTLCRACANTLRCCSHVQGAYAAARQCRSMQAHAEQGFCFLMFHY